MHNLIIVKKVFYTLGVYALFPSLQIIRLVTAKAKMPTCMANYGCC